MGHHFVPFTGLFHFRTFGISQIFTVYNFLGPRRCLPEGTASVTRCSLLYGQNIHRHFHPGNGSQMVGSGFCQILYQRLVLAGLCHSHGKIWAGDNPINFLLYLDPWRMFRVSAKYLRPL